MNAACPCTMEPLLAPLHRANAPCAFKCLHKFVCPQMRTVRFALCPGAFGGAIGFCWFRIFLDPWGPLVRMILSVLLFDAVAVGAILKINAVLAGYESDVCSPFATPHVSLDPPSPPRQSVGQLGGWYAQWVVAWKHLSSKPN